DFGIVLPWLLGCSPIWTSNFDDFFQHLWPYIGNNTANVVFQIVKRLWLIRIDCNVTSRKTTTTSGVGFFVDSTPTRAASDPAQPLFDPPEESSDPTGR
ncbi:hypothetical protein TNCV_351511, partial [Trichonephila clavipes]